MAKIQVYPDRSALSNAVIDRFIELAKDAIHTRGRMTVALSGGSTPKPVYAGLASFESLDASFWEQIHFFFGDERHVLADHPESNFRMVDEVLFSKIALPGANIHRVRTELDARLAAFDYEDALRRFFDGEWPRFDLVLLGMGSDGHTASLFPHTAALNEAYRWFVAHQVPSLDSWRLTLTKNAINAARQVVVMVSGKSKAKTLAQVLTGPFQPDSQPIQLITPVNGEMVWMIDRDAASQLPDSILDL